MLHHKPCVCVCGEVSVQCCTTSRVSVCVALQSLCVVRSQSNAAPQAVCVCGEVSVQCCTTSHISGLTVVTCGCDQLCMEIWLACGCKTVSIHVNLLMYIVHTMRY